MQEKNPADAAAATSTDTQRRSRELPTPPVGAALVIKAAGDPNVSLAALAKVISTEPGLTTALLRLANSAAYGNGRPVKSVGQAALFLGTRVIRNIAVSHVLRAMTAKTDAGGFDLTTFWEDSLRRACAGLVLARRAGFEDPSEVFTVGLIQDLGVLMLAVQYPEHGAALEGLRTRPSYERLVRERDLFGRTHPEVFVGLAREWGLPEDLVDAVGHHHEDSPVITQRRTARLAQLARAADAIADVTQTNAMGETVLRARRIVEALETREPLSLDSIIDDTAAEMAAQSSELEIRVQKQPTYDALMEKANTALLNISLSYEELTQRLELALAEKEELAKKLKASNDALRRLATVDALTGVGNRRFFTESLERVLDQLARSGRPLTIVTLDLDLFKQVNDAFGHAGGDDVLVEIGERLRRATRATDVVARLGGEEFGVLLPECGETDGKMVAERIRSGIGGKPIRCRDGREVTVTASFGGVTLTRRVPGDDALSSCDEALYKSKDTGRNRVTWAGPL